MPRAKRFPGTTLRSDGRWMGYWRDRQGQRHAVYGRTAEAVWNQVQEKEGSTRQGLQLDNPTMLEQWEVWLRQRPNMKATTREHWRQVAIYGLVPFAIAGTRIKDVTYLDIQAMLADWERHGYALSTRKRRYGVIKLFFRELIVPARLRSDDPTIGVKLPRGADPQRKALNIPMAKALLAAAAGHRLEALLTVGLILGVRMPGEVSGLRWGDYKDGRLTIRNQVQRIRISDGSEGWSLAKPGKYELRDATLKTQNSYRELDVPAALAEPLARHRTRQIEELMRLGIPVTDDTYIFTNEKGGRIHPASISAAFQDWLIGAGLAGQGIALYGTRHTAASLVYAMTKDIELVRRMLGHSTIAITSNYVKSLVGDEGMPAAAAAMEGIFGR